MSVFITEGADLLPLNLQSSWEYLAVMQHHGVPTRLLDWTESLDTALFFALWGTCTLPCIWVLNPFRVNYHAVGKNIVFCRTDPIEYDYYTEIKDRQRLPHDLPIALHPPWISSRIKRQKGCFTMHGNDTRSLDSLYERVAKRVDIPHHLVRPLRKYLRDRRVDDFELFPDLDGLCRTLRRRFRLT